MVLVASLLAAFFATSFPADAPDGSSARVAAPDEPVLTGELRFVGGQRQRELVVQAIERSVESLPRFHDVARKRLTKANAIPETVRMSMDGPDLVVIYGDQAPQRAPLDGSPREWRNPEGQTITLTHELRGDRLVQTTSGGGGRRVMVWSFDHERGLVRVQSTMSSPRLPVPVRYRLTFKQR
jgi:hypothetical protein